MRVALMIALLLPLSLATALADVYRSVDAHGQVQYSDTPTPGAQLVHISSLRNGNSTSPAADTSKPGNNDADAVHDKLAQDSAARAVQKDVAVSRSDQCKKAQQDYEQSVQARRIYKTGKDGEREYLSDADADQMRLNIRLQMETACKN